MSLGVALVLLLPRRLMRRGLCVMRTGGTKMVMRPSIKGSMFGIE
jgi:hypothetical protein